MRGKEEGISLIAIGVENDGDSIIRAQARIALHLCAEDFAGLRVVAHDADIEVIGIVAKHDFGSFTGTLGGPRFSLNQVANFLRGTPHWLLKYTVERDIG